MNKEVFSFVSDLKQRKPSYAYKADKYIERINVLIATQESNK